MFKSTHNKQKNSILSVSQRTSQKKSTLRAAKFLDNRAQTNIIQRYTDRKVQSPPTYPAARFLFNLRNQEGTATTGVHNYAVMVSTQDWARSSSNGHAELKLLTRYVNNQPGAHIQMVSEFKPCPDCQADIQQFENTHGVNVRVNYLIDYEGRGDGDKNAVRELYKSAGWLTGGGEYTYQVNV